MSNGYTTLHNIVIDSSDGFYFASAVVQEDNVSLGNSES